MKIDRINRIIQDLQDCREFLTVPDFVGGSKDKLRALSALPKRNPIKSNRISRNEMKSVNLEKSCKSCLFPEE
jgi:hypothetical protein